jgi:hypothetical protein
MRWPAWLTLGLILQALGLRQGKPLTEWIRSKVTAKASGSAFTGGLLLWALYHWVIDTAGIDLWDVGFFALGALVGLIGWCARHHGCAD